MYLTFAQVRGRLISGLLRSRSRDELVTLLCSVSPGRSVSPASSARSLACAIAWALLPAGPDMSSGVPRFGSNAVLDGTDGGTGGA